MVLPVLKMLIQIFLYQLSYIPCNSKELYALKEVYVFHFRNKVQKYIFEVFNLRTRFLKISKIMNTLYILMPLNFT